MAARKSTAESKARRESDQGGGPRAAAPEAASLDVAVAGPVPDGADANYYSEEAATLGDRIAAARQKVGLTQAGLASRLGVGAKIVSAWENDRSEPRANRLATLSGLLGVSVAWLLTGRGEGVDPAGAADAHPTATFHISVALDDLGAGRAFYVDLLGCPIGRGDEREQTFGFFGGWLTVFRRDPGDVAPLRPEGLSDLRSRPTPSIGVVLEWDSWTTLIERLRTGGATFLVEPTIRHVGAPEEEGAFYIADPGGNALEFRAHRDQSRVMG